MKKYTVKLALFSDDGKQLMASPVTSQEIEKAKEKGISALDAALEVMITKLDKTKDPKAV